MLARELESARHGHERVAVGHGERLTALETERAALDRARHELQGQLDVAIRDRELIIAELETTRADRRGGASAEARTSTTSCEDSADARVRQLEMEMLRRGDRAGERDVELAELVEARARSRRRPA